MAPRKKLQRKIILDADNNSIHGFENSVSYEELKVLLTFLKVTRSHAILPKQPKVTGICVFIMMVGKIFHNSIGSKYHLNCVILWSTPSNALLILWQSSLHTKINPNDQHSSYRNIMTAILSYVPYDWKKECA